MRFLLMAAVVLAAAAARADDGLEQRYKIGEARLADRRFRVDHHVFAIEGHPELMLSVLGPEDPTPEERRASLERLALEQKTLDALAKDGVPVLSVLDFGTWRGRPAYV